jgi:hypothetical protein
MIELSRKAQVKKFSPRDNVVSRILSQDRVRFTSNADKGQCDLTFEWR